MSEYYSEFERNSLLNFLQKAELPSVLKNEVELVKGTRTKAKTKLHLLDEDQYWGGGGGDSGVKVVEMKLRILRRSWTVEEKDEDYHKMKTVSVNLLKKYCITHRIPLQIWDVRFGRQRAGGGEERKSGVGRPSEAGKSPRWSNKSKSITTNSRARASGAGDGKRPPEQPPSSSEPDSAWPWTETEEEMEQEPSTETTDAYSHIFPSKSETIRKKSSIRKSKLPRQDDSQTSEMKMPSPSFPFEPDSTKIKNELESDATLHVSPTKSLRRSTLKKKRSTNQSLASRKSTLNRISVHSYKTTGKLDNISVIDKKLSTQQRRLFPEKMTPLPRPFEKSRKKMRAEMKTRRSSFTSLFELQSPTESNTKTNARQSSLPSISDISDSFIYKDESLFLTTKETQINHPQVPHRRSKVGLWTFQARKLRAPRPGLPIRPSVVTSLSDVKKIMNAERTDEWLEWTSSEEEYEGEKSLILEKEPEEDLKKTDRPIQQDLKAFMNSTRVLDKINSVFGLCPYTKVVRSNRCVQVRWERRSGKYIYLSLNSIFYFMTTLFIFMSFLSVLRYDKPLPSSQQIIKISFAQHFLEALFLTLLNFFLTIWSVSSVFSMGAHYAEFYSRFNLGICFTKYNVSEGIHEMIVKHLGVVLIFETVMVFLFFSGRENYPIVRESCGFLGYTMLRQFNNQIRESVYYPLVEILGLIVFLHCFFCFNMVLLQFAVYATALENMAERFNIKLAFAFGAIVSTKSSTPEPSTKAIPYSKLYAEHRVITSLFRMLTEVNSIAFGTFLFCLVCEMALVMWLFFDLFLEMHLPTLKNVNARQAGELELVVPLRLQKGQTERVMKTIIIFSITWLTYWGFGNALHNAGDSLLRGGDYVRRHGLTRCRSSKERRFILSMITSFSPKNVYWIGKRFKFNRAVLLTLMAFVIGSSIVTASFRFDHLELTSIETCSKFGFCNEITVSKQFAHRLYAVLDLAPTPAPPPTSQPMPDTTETGSIAETFKLDTNLFILKPPCGSSGTYPVENVSILTFKCPADWDFISEIELPYFYTSVKISSYNYHRQMMYTFKDSSTNMTDLYRCRTQDTFDYDFGSPNMSVSDCFGNEVNMEALDDCGNPGLKSHAVLKPILTEDLPDIPISNIICCYEYPGLKNNKNQLKTCHTPDAPTFLVACEFGTDRQRMRDHPHVLQHHDQISIRIHYETEFRNNTNWFQLHEETIQKCLCKLKEPQLSLDSDENCRCTGLHMLPCIVEDLFKEFIPDDYSLKCGQVRAPLLFKIDSKASLVFHGEHYRYRLDCKEPAFHDRFDHGESLRYRNPCDHSPSAPRDLTLVDCSGNPITRPLESADDCSNFRIHTPQIPTGVMLPPSLTLRQFNYDKNSKKIVERESSTTTKAFLCCYQYASQVFQTPAQNRYCNAPNIDAMTKSAWCGRIVSYNGRRQPGPLFKGEKYEQLLRKLEQSVRYHAVNRGLWLESPEINQKWIKCICPDKLEIDEKRWEMARLEECKPLIPSPLNLFEKRIIQPFPLCKPSWPAAPEIPSYIMTPAPFIFQFEIWDMVNRFMKIGASSETSPCLLNLNYEERYKNDGNPRLFDNLLNELPRGNLDDCSSLPIRTPLRSGGGGGVPIPPELELIAVNQITSQFGMNDERFFCCYEYALGMKNQVQVCNMPSKSVLERKCRLSASSQPHIAPYVKKLKEKRRVGSGMRDDLASGVDFSDPARILWTRCLCEKDVSSCKKASPRTPSPPPTTTPQPTDPTRCFRLPSTEEKFFTKCKSLTKTGEWASLKFIFYPTILQTFYVNNMYHQRLVIKAACDPDGYGKPLPANTIDFVANTPVADCHPTEFQHGSQYFEDSCKNPILHKEGSWWNQNSKMLLIRVTVLDRKAKKVACCVDYGLQDSTQSRKQALVCNKPSEELRNTQCIEKSGVGSLREQVVGNFLRKWDSYNIDEPTMKKFESDSGVVKCLCQELSYVRMKYPKTHILEIVPCKLHINNFH